MPVTRKEVIAVLDRDEFDYHEAAASLGSGAVPHLRELVTEDDEHLAPRAAYLASLIDSQESVDIVRMAGSRRSCSDPRCGGSRR